MSVLYDKVRAQDPGIADRWKARTRDNTTFKLRASDIDVIMSPLFKTRTSTKITEKQAQAIVTLVQETGLTKDGVERIRFYVQLAEQSRALDAQPLVTADELKPVFDSLTHPAVSKIMFTSPKTGLSYDPSSYLTIREIIVQKKIFVIQLNLAGLAVLAKMQGEYASTADILFIYNGLSPTARSITIVHEATHAIQDWRDVGGMSAHIEADAFIAESVAANVLTGDSLDDAAVRVAAFKAGQLVIDGKATGSNKAWLTAYDNVVDALFKDPFYKNQASERINATKGETTSESDQYNAVHSAPEKRDQEFRKWVTDTANDAVNTLAHDLASVLP
jgi:hypothetical protein